MKVICVNRVKVINANAISSLCVIGFPAVTGFLGAVHNLGRKINIKFSSAAVVSHACDVEWDRPNGFSNFSTGRFLPPLYEYNNIHMLKKPITDRKKANAMIMPSFIPAARVKLDISLLIPCEVPVNEALLKKIKSTLMQIRVAGGDVISCGSVSCFETEDDESVISLKHQLMPGFFLTDMSKLLSGFSEDERADTLLKYISDTYVPEFSYDNSGSEEKEFINCWRKIRNYDNFVPLVAGYRQLTDLRYAEGQINPEFQHCFAESVMTLGKFSLVSLTDFQEENIFWKYTHNDDAYLCKGVSADLL